MPSVNDFGTLASLDTSRVRHALNQLVRNLPEQVEKALFAEAQVEMTESKRRTPVRDGHLRASGMVHRPERGGSDGRDLSVALTYGNASVGYAAAVHEDLDAIHPVGQAKFLESTLNESRPSLAKRLAKRLDLWSAVR